ncbi:MAG TPA: PEP-CTERM sorting domain-containing protein, partial [Lacipirellulaceae bacterium]
GGGKWLDISGVGLTEVGFIRFSVADDGTSRKLNFELDAVSVSHAALGTATPEPATSGLIAMALVTIGAFTVARRPQRQL